jgi:hypothetical protein
MYADMGTHIYQSLLHKNKITATNAGDNEIAAGDGGGDNALTAADSDDHEITASDNDSSDASVVIPTLLLHEV